MSLWQSILLGLIQGLTEFLPISSSAHLVLAPYLLGWQIPAEIAFVFDILVQVATLAGVVTYFWADLVAIARAVLQGFLQRQPWSTPEARLGWRLVLASLPAGLFGLAIKDHVEAAFANPLATAGFLLVTAGLLLVAERLGQQKRSFEQVTWQDALWVGAFQALSIFPGISRSGATITGGMLRGLERPAAARFSFLMSVPIMFAAGLWALIDLPEAMQAVSLTWNALLPIFLPGLLSAAMAGYLSIRWLLRFLLQRSLVFFAVYCLVISLITYVLS